MTVEDKASCPHDVNELLKREREYSRWNEHSGAVWCADCRCWIWFTWEKRA